MYEINVLFLLETPNLLNPYWPGLEVFHPQLWVILLFPGARVMIVPLAVVPPCWSAKRSPRILINPYREDVSWVQNKSNMLFPYIPVKYPAFFLGCNMCGVHMIGFTSNCFTLKCPPSTFS